MQLISLITKRKAVRRVQSLCELTWINLNQCFSAAPGRSIATLCISPPSLPSLFSVISLRGGHFLHPKQVRARSKNKASHDEGVAVVHTPIFSVFQCFWGWSYQSVHLWHHIHLRIYLSDNNVLRRSPKNMLHSHSSVGIVSELWRWTNHTPW